MKMESYFLPEKTMLLENEALTEQDLKGWPSHWPPPCKFLGPLIFNIISLRATSTLTEHQAILRFKNRYGVRISENFFHQGLFLVDILRFHGIADDAYDLVYDAPIPDPTWYFNSQEVFALSEQVAQWERHPGPIPNSLPYPGNSLP